MLQELVEKIFLPYFMKTGEASIKFLVNGSVSGMAFLSEYKKLKPLEALNKKEKDDLKKYVIDLFPEFTSEQKLNACKIIYTIGTLA